MPASRAGPTGSPPATPTTTGSAAPIDPIGVTMLSGPTAAAR